MTVLLLLVACAHGRQTLDADLVDPVTAVATTDPRAVLEAAAADGDPNPRARALALLAHDPAWATRGLYDPDPWVQAAVVRALIARLPEPAAATALDAYARRTDALADPTARADAAFARGLGGEMAAACAAEPSAWRAGPSCLAAARMGDQASLDALARGIASGDVPLDERFLDALAGSGLTALAPAAKDGALHVEEEIAIPFAAVRAGVGDGSGEADLRHALGDADEMTRLVALDATIALPDDVGRRVLRATNRRGSAEVKAYAALALAVHGKGGTDAFAHAMRSDAREIRVLAATLAARLPDDKRVDRALADVVARGIVDEDPEVRTRSLALASARDLPFPRDAVTALLADDYLDVRIEAAGLLVGP